MASANPAADWDGFVPIILSAVGCQIETHRSPDICLRVADSMDAWSATRRKDAETKANGDKTLLVPLRNGSGIGSESAWNSLTTSSRIGTLLVYTVKHAQEERPSVGASMHQWTRAIWAGAISPRIATTTVDRHIQIPDFQH
jgi:hypothetical protein